VSERIARRAAQRDALGVSDTRGSRFARRHSDEAVPDFADMAAVPRWVMLPGDQQVRVAHAIGLMQHRTAIDRELSGPRLAMLAEAVGEDLLDAVCAAEANDSRASDAPLPRPDMIAALGWETMHRGLPTLFATRFHGASGDASARAISENAVNLVLAL
jgi:hypothetical protein